MIKRWRNNFFAITRQVLSSTSGYEKLDSSVLLTHSEYRPNHLNPRANLPRLTLTKQLLTLDLSVLFNHYVYD